MTISVKHAFQSAKADGGDSTLLRPSNWNAEHAITIASGKLIGRLTAGSGAIEEIAVTSYGATLFNVADVTGWLAASGLLSANVTWAATFNAAQAFQLSGTVSPAALVADVNDWSPTGMATASFLRTAGAVPVNITGLATGAAGRIVLLQNIGVNAITLKANNNASSAANRFAIPNDYVIQAGNGVVLFYDGTTSNWRIPQLMPAASVRPTTTDIASGSGTYTTPTGATWLKVRVLGAGGGGGGTGSGGAGGSSTFNSVTANGGGGGGSTSTLTGGAGGSGGAGSGAVRFAGSGGDRGFIISGAALNASGGAGGAGPYGGAGPSNTSGAANTGSGGGGATGTGANAASGGGGGAGEYFELIIQSPAATYSYAVGAGGAAGAGGGGGGGSGRIIVEEYYT
jgi:hypothetical protein